jgi:uncharacterized protein YdhG (YjbR/CyaY superfamily)
MKNVNEYIACFPADIQKILTRIRKIILNKAPDALESITYDMPSYKTYGKPLIYFAGFKNHIGLYATPSGHTEFASELAGYKHGKGSVQFSLDKPIPYDLIRKIVEFRVEENKDKYETIPESKTKSSEIKLTKTQIEDIKASMEDLGKGSFIENKILDKEVKKWLSVR